MAKLTSSSSSSSSSLSKKKKNGIIDLKIVAKKLQKSLNSLGKKPYGDDDDDDDDEFEVKDNYVPKDVKEGHFPIAVIAEGEEPKRFVVPLSSLSNPMFLRLLEQAAEEYGFDHMHQGALTIPCNPSDLERILADRDHHHHRANWAASSSSSSSSSSITMLQSC